MAKETVKLFADCQEAAKLPASANPASCSWPAGPWKTGRGYILSLLL
jgi:hypothetical protein